MILSFKYQMTICKIINNTRHNITCDLLFKRIPMKHICHLDLHRKGGVLKRPAKKNTHSIQQLNVYIYTYAYTPTYTHMGAQWVAVSRVECLTQDRRAVGSSLTSLSKNIRGDRGKMIHFLKIFLSCFYDWIYLIAFKSIIHFQVLATT